MSVVKYCCFRWLVYDRAIVFGPSRPLACIMMLVWLIYVFRVVLWYLPVSPWSWSYTFACMISVQLNRGRHSYSTKFHMGSMITCASLILKRRSRLLLWCYWCNSWCYSSSLHMRWMTTCATLILIRRSRLLFFIWVQQNPQVRMVSKLSFIGRKSVMLLEASWKRGALSRDCAYPWRFTWLFYCVNS